MAQPGATAGRPARDLRALPKAHLHLHFGGAVARRDTLEEFATLRGWPAQRAAAVARAEARVAKALENGEERRAAKYRRRVEILTAEDVVSAAFGPPPPAADAPEAVLALDVSRVDAAQRQPGAAGVWDAQYVAAALIAAHPEGMARVLAELYEDAVQENIAWVEVCYSLYVREGAVDAAEGEKLRGLLAVRSALEAQHAGACSVAFVLNCPRTRADAEAVLAFVHQTEEARAAIAGVGQWGPETRADERRSAYAVFSNAGLPLLSVHAGENCLQACCPAGDEVDEAIREAYDGPAYVRAALSLPGIRRVGHGIEVAADASLVAEMARRADVCLEVCPISNRQLGYCEGGLARHPLAALLAGGVPCCLAADDPAFLGSRSAHGLLREFVAARHLVALSDAQLAACARASFQYAACPPAVRDKGLAGIDAWLGVGFPP